MAKETFLSSIYIVIRNAEGKVLLQRRQGTKLWPGFLAFPAGHIDEGEDAYEALTREAREELNITVTKEDVMDVYVVCRKNKSLKSYYDVYFELKSYKGEVAINEPDKCSELVWADLDHLPDDMVDFEKEAILLNKKGIKFSTVYADNEKKL